MSQPLTDRTAVITGGGSGIGYAIAERFTQAGAQVVLVGRTRQRLEATAAQLGPAARALPADVTDDAQLRSVFEQLDRVDVLVTCAGGSLFGPVEEVPLADVQALFAVRVFGQLNAARYAVPRMTDGGTIIFCSGCADVMGMPLYSAGTAVDGAVSSMTRSLAVELGPRNIRVNAISPGTITQTGIQSNFTRDQLMAYFASMPRVPLGRFGLPAEAAEAAFFLSTCGYVTGQVVQVDGGWSAG